MPRMARIVIPNLPHQVTQRGNMGSAPRFEEHTLLASVFLMHQSVGQGILDDQGTHPGLRNQLVAGRG